MISSKKKTSMFNHSSFHNTGSKTVLLN